MKRLYCVVDWFNIIADELCVTESFKEAIQVAKTQIKDTDGECDCAVYVQEEGLLTKEFTLLISTVYGDVEYREEDYLGNDKKESSDGKKNSKKSQKDIDILA